MKNILIIGFPEDHISSFLPLFLRAVGEMALKSNTLNFRSIKGQSHHSAGTCNSLLERKHYDSTQSARSAHDMAAHWGKSARLCWEESKWPLTKQAKGGAMGPTSPPRDAPL